MVLNIMWPAVEQATGHTDRFVCVSEGSLGGVFVSRGMPVLQFRSVY